MKTVALTNAAKKELTKGLRFSKKFHWGIRPDKVLTVRHGKIPRVFVQLGFLRSVTYQTSKKGDKRDALYIHSFDPPYPVLACDPEGKQIFVLGGRYTITEDGIVH